LLEKNLAIASYTKALEFRNGKCFRRVTEEGYPSSVTLREGNLQKPYQSINTSYPIRKTWWLYLLLEKNLAIASYTKALEFRNGKCFRRVTEEGYSNRQGG
jgi:hypothetical protein